MLLMFTILEYILLIILKKKNNVVLLPNCKISPSLNLLGVNVDKLLCYNKSLLFIC